MSFTDDFENGALILTFVWRDCQVRMPASARGWAKLYLKQNPWHSRRTRSEEAYAQQALDQGLIAVNSIIRDWVRGQLTALETGVTTFETVFLPYIVTRNGLTVSELVQTRGIALPELSLASDPRDSGLTITQ